ncbi:hypothetical protein AALB19_14195 [Oscillospiraceae bacterium 50-58]
MSNNKTYDDYLKNYFNKRPALLFFGERFIKDVFDPSIERFLKAYDGEGNTQFVDAIKKYIEIFSEEQIEVLKKLTEDIVYDSLSAMLDLFVLRPELSITVEQDGEKVDILEISDSFCNDIIGDDGCIDLFSKYPNVK